eukprot:c31506_g1_i1 orf=1-243(-)
MRNCDDRDDQYRSLASTANNPSRELGVGSGSESQEMGLDGDYDGGGQFSPTASNFTSQEEKQVRGGRTWKLDAETANRLLA